MRTTMLNRQNCGGPDRFRILAAVLVIAVHTSPLASFSGDADFFLTRILARVAVPFFFMVTGQFALSRQLTSSAGTGLIKYVGKLSLIYGLAAVLYLPLGIYAGHYKGITAGRAMQMLVFEGTFYHLWYFPACILGVLLVGLMSRFMSLRGMLAVSGGLYVIGLFGDSYYGLTQEIPLLSSVYDAIFRISPYTRNGLFFAPMFLTLGAAAGVRESGFRSRAAVWTGLLLSFGLMTGEAFLLRFFGLPRHDSMYFFLVPVMIILYRILLTWKIRPAKRLRTISAWIYILHPAMIVVVRGAAKVLHMSALLIDNSLIHYLAVTVLSFAAALAAALTAESVKRGGDPGGEAEREKEPQCARAWIELDRKALHENIDALRSMLPDTCSLMPAVKADAYGHGAVLIAEELSRHGVSAFCVATAMEGAELRRAGIKGELLVLGYTHPSQFDLLRRYHLTQTIVDYAYAVRLNEYGKDIHVHIGIDTGMHRLGIRCEQIDLIGEIFGMENLRIDGIFTHLCASDKLDKREQNFTDQQAEKFYTVIRRLKDQGFSCPKIHLQSSYGILNYPELSGDYARVGIALYGVLSTKEDMERWEDVLSPVLSLKARVASVKTLYRGETAGYGMAFTAERDMKIAAITVGYGDGLPRILSGGGGYMLINGYRAPVVGRICMDQTIVDVSGIPDIKAGDVAVLIGKSGDKKISAGDLAEWAGTITNEILSRMGERLERVIV